MRHLWVLLKELAALPKVEVRMWGGEEGAQIYRYFTRLHPRYWVIRNKVWGVALIRLPDTFDEYLRGKNKQALRTNRKRALVEGFCFGQFAPLEHLGEILDINRSKPVRQGKPMAKTYIQEQELAAHLDRIPSMFGVFNGEGQLRAYAYVPVYGEVGVISRLLGHGDDLNKGIMYLLLSEVIRELIELKQKQGVPRWVMYDTFLGQRRDCATSRSAWVQAVSGEVAMVSDMFRGLAHRFYSDFLLPCRLREFHFLLEQALGSYEVHSVRSLWEILKVGRMRPGRKYLVLRHDIDTDLRTARQIWEIEKRLGVRSSYYFRLSTLDIDLMREIEATGGEASCHYEELATYAKSKGLGDRNAVLAHLDVIRKQFAQNLNRLRDRTGLPMRIVASHGDWINRRLGLANWVILEDRTFRREVEVELEVYDHEFMRFVTSRHSDAPYPIFWKPKSPFEALWAGEPFVYVLVHPRHWQANVAVNFVDNLLRLWEGTAFRLRVLWKSK